ncbi:MULTISPECIES: LysR family transcriptional regulator [unclassified Janthinobacterium]|uniref:LysR family transcriptional regulator n=1 Tax=unclassified Janthinobacterium TaxID=2610881 RepID=UPI001620A133|nr:MULTISPECIES: LysR family transcriptional regulator [unclassified Janthinobacterium]MBB5367614.1 DNA-binding transcriptional LysR family regulator [Janthinobacterium sp. K2C7]MBB5379908.1 DNA-binding transcriptional LysR family regulator [Janthinobacterium sp. K2Li3]MBB5385996.1 DNA-binding transcriptional LysR family regulator [Janthinobacterium sp. K2E3]
MDKLRSMEIFVAVVDQGSFTAAADSFRISPVMVGKHVKYLEQRLGTRLLTRTTRRQNLTEIGQQYVEQCRQILAQIAAAETGAEAMRATPRGKLKISAPVSFGSERIAPLMADYLTAYPDVSLELNLNDRMVDLVEEGYDAAIRIGALEDSSMVARPLRHYAMVICASPDYLARHGTPRTPDELLQHECVDFMQWSRHMRWRLSGKEARHDSAPAESRFRSNNGQALRMAALHGFGIVMQAEILLADDIAAGTLVPILQDYVPAPRLMHLLYPRDRQPTPKLTTFIDFIMERYGPVVTPPATLT